MSADSQIIRRSSGDNILISEHVDWLLSGEAGWNTVTRFLESKGKVSSLGLLDDHSFDPAFISCTGGGGGVSQSGNRSLVLPRLVVVAFIFEMGMALGDILRCDSNVTSLSGLDKAPLSD